MKKGKCGVIKDLRPFVCRGLRRGMIIALARFSNECRFKARRNN